MKVQMLFIIALVLFFGISGNPVSADFDQWFETWETDTGGTNNQADWTYEPSAGYWPPHTPPACPGSVPDGSWSLRFADSNGKEGYRDFGPAAGGVEITFYYAGLNDGSGSNYKRVAIYSDTGTHVLNMNFLGEAGQLLVECSGIETTRTAAYSTWVKVHLSIRPEIGDFDWYFEDSLVGTFGLSGGAGQTLSRFLMNCVGNGTQGQPGVHTGWIDAISIVPVVPGVCGDPYTDYAVADINGPGGDKDCQVNLYDFAAFARDWQLCADPTNPDCNDFWADAFDLYWGGPSLPFPEAAPLELTLGADEYESVELSVLMRRRIGAITARVPDGSLPAGAVRVGSQDGISNPAGAYPSENQYGIVYHIDPNLPEPTLILEVGEQKSFWLTFNTHLLTPGDYSFNVEVEPSVGPTTLVPITLHVLDVQKGSRCRAAINLYHTMNYIMGGINDHVEMLYTHHIRQVHTYFPFSLWDSAVTVTRDGGDNLQADFTGLDGILSNLYNAGLDELAFLGGYYNENWFSALSYEDPCQQAITRKEFGAMLCDHLLAYGFHGPDGGADCNDVDPNALWFYVLDEPSIAYATDPTTIAMLADIQSVHSAMKTHATLTHYSTSMVNTINSGIDVWTPALITGTCQTMLEDIDLGSVTIDAGEPIGFYRSAHYYDSPDLTRSYGWQAGYYGVDHYSLFAYTASTNLPPNKLFVIVDEQYVPTVAFEGVRDGFEDYAYWQRLAMVLEEAESIDPGSLTPQQQADLAAAQGFKAASYGSTIPLATTSGSHGARDWQEVDNPDRWTYRAVKVELLNHIAAVQDILDQ